MDENVVEIEVALAVCSAKQTDGQAKRRIGTHMELEKVISIELKERYEVEIQDQQ